MISTNFRRWMRSALLGVTAAVGTLAAASSLGLPMAAAATITASPAGTVTPAVMARNAGPSGYFQYTLAPGATSSGTIEISNPASAPASFTVRPVGAATSAATGVVFSDRVTPGPPSWLHIGTGLLSLGGRQRTTAQFSVQVPPGTAPGQYVAGVSVASPRSTRSRTSTDKGMGVSLAVTTRAVIAVVVRVPGPAAVAMHLGTPHLIAQNGTRQLITLPIHDTGGLLAKPHLTASVSRCVGGKYLGRLDQQLNTFVPSTSIDYDWSLNSLVLPAGCYRVSAALALGGQSLSSVSGTVHVTHQQASVRPPTVTPGPEQFRSAGMGLTIPVAAGSAAAVIVLSAAVRSRRTRRRLERQVARLQQDTL